MGRRVYIKDVLTGGRSNALDGIDPLVLNDGDMAIVLASGNASMYKLDEDSGEDENDPGIIRPDGQYAGNKRWIKQSTGGGGGGGIGVSMDGGSNIITTGFKGSVAVPFACTILGWYLTADATGSMTVDVWKRAGAVPTSATYSIVGSEKPTLSSASYNSDTTLTTWTSTTVAAGDVFGFNVDTCSGIYKATLVVSVMK